MKQRQVTSKRSAANHILRRCVVLLFALLSVILSSQSMAFASGQASSTLSDGMIFCQVVDSLSGESLPFANIINENRPNRSLVADENGCFRIPKSRKLDRWRVEYTGYVSRPLEIAADDYELRIMMEPASTDLQEIVVRPKKEKYSKKNNPAVDFVRKIREASKEIGRAHV